VSNIRLAKLVELSAARAGRGVGAAFRAVVAFGADVLVHCGCAIAIIACGQKQQSCFTDLPFSLKLEINNQCMQQTKNAQTVIY
jgi:hypothetical protein